MGAKYISLLYVLVDFNILPALLHPISSCPGWECYMPPRNGIHVGTIQNICIHHSSESVNLKAISLLYYYYRGSREKNIKITTLLRIKPSDWGNGLHNMAWAYHLTKLGGIRHSMYPKLGLPGWIQQYLTIGICHSGKSHVLHHHLLHLLSKKWLVHLVSS